MIVIGRYDSKVEIQRAVESRGATGGLVLTWETVHSPWAEVKYLKGAELVQAQAVAAKVQVAFTIRFASEVSVVNAKHRVLYEGGGYEILEVLPVPGGRPIKLQILTDGRAD